MFPSIKAISVLFFLALLLGRMTTYDIVNRFTALEALTFCQFIRSSLNLEVLDKELPARAVDTLSADASPEPSAKTKLDIPGSMCFESAFNNTGCTPSVSSLALSHEPQNCQWESLP